MKEHNDKLYLALALGGIIVGLSACSHNTAGITVGTRVNAGLDPQNATANISYSDGLNVVDVSRENSTWQLEVDSDSGLSYDEQSGSVKGVRKIRRSIGPQITGYLVDLSERNPEAAIEYVKAMRAYWESEAAKAASKSAATTEEATVTEETATEAMETVTEEATEDNAEAEEAKEETTESAAKESTAETTEESAETTAE